MDEIKKLREENRKLRADNKKLKAIADGNKLTDTPIKFTKEYVKRGEVMCNWNAINGLLYKFYLYSYGYNQQDLNLLFLLYEYKYFNKTVFDHCKLIYSYDKEKWDRFIEEGWIVDIKGPKQKFAVSTSTKIHLKKFQRYQVGLDPIPTDYRNPIFRRLYDVERGATDKKGPKLWCAQQIIKWNDYLIEKDMLDIRINSHNPDLR